MLAIEEDISEDARGQDRHFRNDVNAVLKSELPEFVLVDTCTILLRELTLWLQRHETDGQLRHWVHVLGKIINNSCDVGRESLAVVKLLLEGLDLSICWHFTGEE